MDQRYTIGKRIGTGKSGLVHRGFDTFLKREVVIKRVLDPKKATEDEIKAAAKKLIKEAQTLSSLNHPNAVTVLDVGIDEQGGYVVMELLEGETLTQTIERDVLTQEDFVEMATQTMEALIAAHAGNLIHRNLKPSNLMIIWQPSGRFITKILDIGLSKFSPKPSLQTSNTDGTIMGSIPYMSPEQFERQELDARTDLYSIGCVYYYALSGQYAYEGNSQVEIMNSHMKHKVTPLAILRPDLAPSICQWVMWLINRDVDNRPDDAQEALKFLPMQLNPAYALDLQEIPVEKTGKVQPLAAQSVPPPVQGANLPPGFEIVRGGLNETTGKRGSTTTLLIGKPGAKPKPQSLSENDLLSRKIVSIIIGAAAILAVCVIVIKVLNFRKDINMNFIAAQKVVSPDKKTVKMLLGIIHSKKSTPYQLEMARSAFTRIDGNEINATLVDQIKFEAPTTEARLMLCNILGDRMGDGAVPNLLEVYKFAKSDEERRSILKMAKRLVITAKTTKVYSDSFGVVGDLDEREAIMNIYLEKIASLESTL
jgi:serine/threonine protein kinase